MARVGCSFWLAGLLLLAAPTARAQESAHTTPDALFEQGRLAFERGDLGQARALLQQVVAQDPDYRTSDAGAAAYWLGQVHRVQEDRGAMRRAWQAGLQALRQAGEDDLRLADAYVQDVLATDAPALDVHAEAAYLMLMAHAGRTRPGEAVLLRRHLAQVHLIYPEPAAAPPGVQEAGARLLAWWRRQDPLPATPQNERIEEHLTRLAYALHHYPHPGRPTGLDDRGELYVRLGPPSQQHTIRYDDGAFQREVFRYGVRLSMQDFPANEIWAYYHIADAGYYIFTKQGDHFYLSDAEKLLPASLQGVFDPNRGHSAVAALRYIYKQLALFHHDFVDRYAEVEQYATWQEQQEIAARSGGLQAIGINETLVSRGEGQGRFAYEDRVLGIDPPERFVRRALERGTREDQQARLRRETAMPTQFTALLAGQQMPLAVRTARFLEPDGLTRTEVYWSPLPPTFKLDRATRRMLEKTGLAAYDDFVIQTTLVRHTTDYEREAVQVDAWLGAGAAGSASPPTVVHRSMIRGAASLYHLAVEWDGYVAHRKGADLASLSLGPRVQTAVFRSDSLRALRADAGAFEMSDVMPVLADEGLPMEIDPAALTPYPFTATTPETPLALYFEVYGLTFGPEDRTRYAVTYQVTQQRKGARLAGTRRSTTAGATEQTGAARTAREYIELDTDEWHGAEAVEIEVVVEDRYTGRRASRVLRFDVLSP